MRTTLSTTLLCTWLSGCATAHPSTYAGHPHAEAWQAVWPAPLRYDSTLSPREERWKYQGHDVHLDRLVPPEATGPLVVLVHGGGGHGRLLGPMAVALGRAGLETVAPDLPGYGLTRREEGTPLTLGLWVDVVSALVRAEAARSGRPVVLFGLSIGGTVAWHAAAREPQVKAVLATTLLDLRQADVREAISASPFLASTGLALGASGWLDGLWLPLSWVAPLHKMSDDPALLGQLASDPFLASSMPLGFWRSLATTQPVSEPEAFTTPLLLVHPGADAWTPLALSRPHFERFAGPKRLVALSNGGHLPVEAPARDELVAAVVRFLGEVLVDEARSPRQFLRAVAPR